MHHLGLGAANAHRRVLAIADQTSVTVIDLTTGEVLSTHTIDPNRSTGATNKKRPGRRPGGSVNLAWPHAGRGSWTQVVLAPEMLSVGSR